MNIVYQLIKLSLIWLAVNISYTTSADRRLNKKRHKRAAYQMPSGWEDLVNHDINPEFQCVTDGYFADIHNSCQIYHLCQSIPTVYGTPIINQHTFVCPNQTIFDQSLLTCNHWDQSIPCEMAPDFFYLNSGVGDPSVHFLTDEDLDRRHNYVGLETNGHGFGDRISSRVGPSQPSAPVPAQHEAPIARPDHQVDRSPINIIAAPVSPAQALKPLSTHPVEPSFDYDYPANTNAALDSFGPSNNNHHGNLNDWDNDDDFVTVRRLIL